MPKCNRCTRRTINDTHDRNYGYCNNCLITVAREIIASTPEFDFTQQDEAWRVNARRILVDLYTSMRRGGARHPLNSLQKPMRTLFYTILKKEDFDRINYSYEFNNRNRLWTN